ncbi:MAG: RDD family protein [Nocardioidaceae bacterium]
MIAGDPENLDFAGRRLGLPASGSGSVAGWLRRLAALAVDWAAALLSLTAFVGSGAWSGRGAAALAPLLLLFVELTLLTGLLGFSVGQRVVGVRVVRLDGGPLGIPRAMVRSGLICLAIPPLIFDRDRRGLHDLAVGTVVVRS